MSDYSHAEYTYYKKLPDGTKKKMVFTTKWISTIDNPYGKYKLIRKESKL